MKLGQILVNRGLVSDLQITNLIQKQSQCDRKLGEMLVGDRLISERELQEALQEQYWRRNGFWVIQEPKVQSELVSSSPKH